MKFKTCITLLILHFLIISRAEAQHRIMTLGNSITQSNGSYQSYRYPLWKKLVDAKINFDLVGSMRNNYNSNPYWPVYNGLAFDQDHEGHWGWRADEILNGKSGLGKLSDWLQGYTPDIVLLHLGTNDLIFGYGVTSTLEDLRQIVGVIRAKNPQVKILLAKLIPGSTSSFVKTTIEAFNQQVPALAQELHQSDSPVIVVDQFSGYESVLDNYDGLHPNARGEEKMATKWFEAISSIIRSCPPAPTAIPKAICGPGLVTLTASGAPITGSYRWYTTSLGGTPLQNATSASFTTPMLSATTTYYVSVVNNSCESARVPVTATINLIPPVAVSASSNVIPAGGSTTLTASGASSYVWSPVTGLSSSTGATVTASPAITTTYLVTCTSKNGCVNTTAVTVSVNTGKLSQVINFPPILDKMYGDAPFNLTATSSANLQVLYSIVSGPAILSGRTLTMTGVGTVVVRAYHPGNDWYLAATPVKVSFNVLNSSARQSQSIYFASIPDKTLEDAPFALNATASSGLPVTYSLVLGPATVSAEIVTLTGIGTVTIRAMQVGSDSYHPASAERSFTVKSGNTTSTVCGLMLTSKVTQAEPWYGMWGLPMEPEPLI